MCRYEIDLTGIYIRPLIADDIETLREIRNRKENRRNLLYQDVISNEQQKAWYHSYLKKDNDYMYSVIRKTDNKIIGFAALYEMNYEECKFGRLLVDRKVYKESGLGKFILQEMISLARELFQLKKIKLEVFSDNIPAVRIYTQCGFKIYSSINFHGRELICMELSL